MRKKGLESRGRGARKLALSPDAPRRLEKLLLARGHQLAPESREKLLAYASRLLEWGGRMNLVGPSLLLDPLPSIVEALEPLRSGADRPERFIDIGSGAGLPAIPLAVGWGSRPTLVEPREKRWVFLKMILGELGIDGEVLRCRWEELPPLAPGDQLFGAVTSRALGGAARWAPALGRWLSSNARIYQFQGEQALRDPEPIRGYRLDRVDPLAEKGHFLVVHVREKS